MSVDDPDKDQSSRGWMALQTRLAAGTLHDLSIMANDLQSCNHSADTDTICGCGGDCRHPTNQRRVYDHYSNDFQNDEIPFWMVGAGM